MSQAIKDRWHFLAHLRQLKRYSGFIDLIKNLSIGVAYGLLHTLIWIFEYVHWLVVCWATRCQFLRCQKIQQFFDPPNFGILSHKLAQICINMWIYRAFFFASGVRAMAIWVFWQKINCLFTAQRVNNCNGMSFGNL